MRKVKMMVQSKNIFTSRFSTPTNTTWSQRNTIESLVIEDTITVDRFDVTSMEEEDFTIKVRNAGDYSMKLITEGDEQSVYLQINTLSSGYDPLFHPILKLRSQKPDWWHLEAMRLCERLRVPLMSSLLLLIYW
jgi:hypothetical protein